MPLDPLRQELTRLLDGDPLWDRRVNVLQVTNTSERTMEVRALMSAANSSNAFDLRCHIREGLIRFVQQHYPDSLPVTRLDPGTGLATATNLAPASTTTPGSGVTPETAIPPASPITPGTIITNPG
jgi:hypothetical protein